jgi:hypothetical protein
MIAREPVIPDESLPPRVRLLATFRDLEPARLEMALDN